MKNIRNPFKPMTAEEARRKKEKELKLLKSTATVANHLAKGQLDKAFKSAVVSGIKLAEPQFNAHASPLLIANILLKDFGPSYLAWKPETLMSAIDKKMNEWSDEKASLALEHFHNTGEIKTDVPPLLRQKIYAIRTVITSDSPHTEWHIFEKVGCVFNDRVANFGVVERLSPMECARTIALMETLRPDSYSDEIKAYIAASAHEDGFYTLKPSKYLKMADEQLSKMNKESMGAPVSLSLVENISKKVRELDLDSGKMVDDDLVNIQAAKIVAVDNVGDAVRE